MPVIETTLIEGYDDETKARLSEALHNAARSVIAAPAEGVTVILREVPAANYRRGGTAKTPGPPRPDAAELVRTFLSRMENRDLEGAKLLVSDDFRMVFPGDRRFSRFEELIDWAKGRYAWVKKTHERFDVAPAEDGVSVTCFGTLYGEDLSGVSFEGIRYVDWFLIVDGKIARQHVWNDMAEVRGAAG